MKFIVGYLLGMLVVIVLGDSLWSAIVAGIIGGIGWYVSDAYPRP